jgi:hypothetical protein
MELFNNLKIFSTKYGSEEEIIYLNELENKECGIWNIKPDFLYNKDDPQLFNPNVSQAHGK